MESQHAWQPPIFDVSRPPSLAHEAHLPPDPHFPQNFARSAKWCVRRYKEKVTHFFSFMPWIYGIADKR
jgi:hypothetical protein